MSAGDVGAATGPREAARPDVSSHRAATATWALLAVAGLGALGLLTWLVASHQPIPFDDPIMAAARPWIAYKDLWNLISQAANFPLIGIGLGIVAWLFVKHRRREAVLVALVLAAATAGSEGLKQLTHRDRPPGSDTVVPGVVYSYPSGHTLEVLTIFGMITLLVWRSDAPRPVKIGVLVFTILFVAAVAVARVAINAHFPSDVLAGLLGGIGILALFALLSRPRDEGPRDEGPPAEG